MINNKTRYKGFMIEEHVSTRGEIMFYRIWEDGYCKDFLNIEDCCDFIDSYCEEEENYE